MVLTICFHHHHFSFFFSSQVDSRASLLLLVPMHRQTRTSSLQFWANWMTFPLLLFIKILQVSIGSFLLLHLLVYALYRFQTHVYIAPATDPKVQMKHGFLSRCLFISSFQYISSKNHPKLELIMPVSFTRSTAPEFLFSDPTIRVPTCLICSFSFRF